MVRSNVDEKTAWELYFPPFQVRSTLRVAPCLCFTEDHLCKSDGQACTCTLHLLAFKCEAAVDAGAVAFMQGPWGCKTLRTTCSNLHDACESLSLFEPYCSLSTASEIPQYPNGPNGYHDINRSGDWEDSGATVCFGTAAPNLSRWRCCTSYYNSTVSEFAEACRARHRSESREIPKTLHVHGNRGTPLHIIAADSSTQLSCSFYLHVGKVLLQPGPCLGWLRSVPAGETAWAKVDGVHACSNRDLLRVVLPASFLSFSFREGPVVGGYQSQAYQALKERMGFRGTRGCRGYWGEE